MTQECPNCHKYFDGLVLHLKNSKCRKEAQLKKVTTIPQNIYCEETDYFSNVDTIDELDILALDRDCIITDVEYNQNDNEEGFASAPMKLGNQLKSNDYDITKQLDNLTSVLQSRAQELLLGGLEDEFDEIELGVAIVDTHSNVNVGVTRSDDLSTIQTEEPFFPLPVSNQNDPNVMQNQVAIVNNNTNEPVAVNADTSGVFYAPLSMFEFKRIFTNEEYFMIKLCQICDKANVPHHIVDDVVDLMRDCKKNNITIQPEQLRKRVHFLKHLANRFKSPIPQSIIVGLEGFSTNDLQYSRKSRDKAEIIWYDFKEQAMDLIHDIGIWGDLDNFEGTIDPKNPFSGQSPRTDGLLDEVVDGAWYNKTYAECKEIAGDEDFLVLGVILYCDKTGTDVNQRAGLEPLSFTFTNFNRKCRYRSEAWRVLGYVPDLEMKSTAYKTKQRLGLMGKGRSCRNHHTCLSKIVETLKKFQGKDEPIREWIRIGDHVSKRRLFFPVAFIIGDSQSQDKMCGRYLAYANVPRICRACDVTPEECENPKHKCKFLNMSDIHDLCLAGMQLYSPEEYGIGIEIGQFTEQEIKATKLEAHENLRLLSQHMHINAFHDVWLGTNTHGLLESLPHDMMHAFRHGVLMYVIEVIMSPLNPSEKYDLDDLVDNIVVPVKSSLKKNYPRCSFTRGITNMTLLTADERAGVAFVLALVAASKPGADMLTKAAARIKRAIERKQKVNLEVDEDGNVIEISDEENENYAEVVYTESLCEPKNMLKMLEMLLGFHAWYKMGHPFCLKTSDDKKKMLKAIRNMMTEIKKNAPREDKNGWRLQKFHDLLHIVRDIENYGSPNNVDAAPNENNLIAFAKRPGRRAHKKQEVFVSQVSKRLRESDLLKKGYNALMMTLEHNKCDFDEVNEEEDNSVDDMDVDVEENEDLEEIAIESRLSVGPLFCVHLQLLYNQGMVECLAGKSVRIMRELHPTIISFLIQQKNNEYFPLFGEQDILIFTEYKRNGTTYRAHPNYNSFGEWYDWAMVKFETVAGDMNFPANTKRGYYDRDLYPCKVLCFLQAKDDSIHAVVHCCNASDHKEDGKLMERWYKEYGIDVVANQLVPQLRCVSVDSFEDSCFVVEDKPGLFEELGNDLRKINNGITLVKPREKGWPKEFLKNTEKN